MKNYTEKMDVCPKAIIARSTMNLFPCPTLQNTLELANAFGTVNCGMRNFSVSPQRRWINRYAVRPCLLKVIGR